MTAACTCPVLLNLQTGHPAFPQDVVRWSKSVRGVGEVRAECRGLASGCFDASAVLKVDPSADIVFLAKSLIKNAIRDNGGHVPHGKARVDTLLDALEETRASSSEESSSEESSSEDEDDAASSRSKDSQLPVIRQAASAQELATPVQATPEQATPVQPAAQQPGAQPAAKRQKTSASSSSSSSSSVAVDWMTQLADEGIAHIWNDVGNQAPLEDRIRAQVVLMFDTVSAHLSTMVAQMKRDMLEANREKGVMSSAVAASICAHARHDIVVKDLVQPALEQVAQEIDAGIRTRLQGFGMS